MKHLTTTTAHMGIHSILFFGCQKTNCSRNASTMSTEVKTCGPHNANFQWKTWSVATKKNMEQKKTWKKQHIFSCFQFFLPFIIIRPSPFKTWKISWDFSPFFFGLWFALQKKRKPPSRRPRQISKLQSSSSETWQRRFSPPGFDSRPRLRETNG